MSDVRIDLDELYDRVGQLIAEGVWNCGNDCARHGDDADKAAAIAIRAVLESLSRNANMRADQFQFELGLTENAKVWRNTAAWLDSCIRKGGPHDPA